MYVKQILCLDVHNEKLIGGILLENGNIIEGESGQQIPANHIRDINDPDAANADYVIYTVYPDWIDLSETIGGYDLYE